MVINNIVGGFEIIANDGNTINNFASGEYVSIAKFPDKVRLFNKLSETSEYFDLYPNQIATINGVSTGFSTVDLLEKYLISNVLYNINKNYFFEVSKGNIINTSTITKFGYNADVDTAAAEDIIGQQGNYVEPTVARLHNITSSSANDTSAGTGARTVLIRGIDGSYNAVSETLTLNGISSVSTVNSYLHIHLAQVQTVGSTGSNVGTITFTAVTDATVTITIEPTYNQSTSSVYMVPVGYKGYIMKTRARMGNSTAASLADVALLVKPFGGGYQLKTILGMNSTGSSFVENDYANSTPFIIQAKSFIKMRCLSVSNNNTTISAEYDLILVKD